MLPIHFRFIRFAMATNLLAFAFYVNASSSHIELGIAAHPQSVITEIDQSVTLAVSIQGPVKSIQWRRNNLDIEGANQASHTFTPQKIKSKPDEYDVVIQDAFGNFIASDKATVNVVEPGSALQSRHNKQLQSFKLQGLFGLIQVFDQADSRITDPLLDSRERTGSVSQYFSGCPDRVKAELVDLELTPSTTQQALRIEMNSCFVPRVNVLGKETGALVSGIFIRSLKKTSLLEKEINVVEKLARNLTLHFPHAKDKGSRDTVDFDIVINGKMIHTIDTSHTQEDTKTIREEYTWAQGTRLENPQTMVKAEFLSGKFVKESFGSWRRNNFKVSRETELFDKLKIKVGDDEVLIDGMVTKITDESGLHRSGHFKISVNGKQVVATPSVISPSSDFTGNLPFAPKLNGFFINDHYIASPSKPLKTGKPKQKAS